MIKNLRNKNFVLLICLIFVGSIAFSAINSANAISQAISRSTSQSKENANFDLLIPYDNTSAIVDDGIINPGEYNSSASISSIGLVVYWQYDNDSIAVGIDSAHTGWVAIGFNWANASVSMQNANIIIGGFGPSSSYCKDMYGVSSGYNIAQDTNNSILSCQATESSGHTYLEFKFPMKTSDPVQDKVMTMGQVMQVIFAYQDTSDNIFTQHTAHAGPFMTYFTPPIKTKNTYITFSYKEGEEVNQGDNITLEATLTNGTVPLVNYTIDFFMVTQFTNVSGYFILNSTLTDANGKATFVYSNAALIGMRAFGARFTGELAFIGFDPVLYAPTFATKSINFIGPTAPGLTTEDTFSYIFFTILLAVVVFVYIVYAYNYINLVRIFRDRKSEVKSREKNSGE